MPNTTDKHTKKIAPIICAALVIGILAIYLALLVLPMVSASIGGFFAAGILLLVILAIGAMMVGVILALRQRLQEIEGGEEDDARQY